MTVVSAGSDTKRKPSLAAAGGQLLAGVGGVVAITSIVAESSKYLPRKPFTSQLLKDVARVVLLHSIRSELMMEGTCPRG